MECKSPTMVRHGNIIYKYPCKKCLPCKIEKTSEWQMRLLMELNNDEWKNNSIFLTLTYNNQNLPKDRGCHIKEISDYNKALRQEGLKFKFFACSEYGDNPERLTYFGKDIDPEVIHRPHYHIIYFGLDNSLSTRELLYRNWEKCDSWKFFGKTWFKTVGNVTKDSCSYVAGYCQKKLFGDMALEQYGNKEPPSQRQSQSIGEKYFLEHMDQYVKDGFILFNGREHPIPEVWKRKFDIKCNTDRYHDLFISKVEQYNKINKTKLNVDDVWNMYKSSSTIGSPLDLVEKSLPEMEAYSSFIDWKNNLRKKHQTIGGKK